MMLGGIPYYLKYFNRKLSLPQNIDSIFFKPNAALKDEYDRLFSSLFTNPEMMKSIIKALSTKNRGLTRKEIISLTGIPDSGDLSNYLKALISGTFIIKYTSFGNSKREEFYKLTDPFCIFWLKFVNNAGGKRISWINLMDTSPVTAWKGFSFENVCWNHIDQIKAAMGISGVTTSESLWSKRGDDSDGTLIDLVIERKDNILNMC